jgi:hypothetical protein
MSTVQAPSAIDQWEARKAALVAEGMTPQQATIRLIDTDKALHSAYIAEFNQNSRSARQPAAQKNSPAPGGGVERFNARKAALLGQGMNLQTAIGHIAKHEPELHAAYLAEVNAGRGTRR